MFRFKYKSECSYYDLVEKLAKKVYQDTKLFISLLTFVESHSESFMAWELASRNYFSLSFFADKILRVKRLGSHAVSSSRF
jgi:hypothetical protein